MKKIQTLCNKKAKMLHTDGVKEQNTKELRNYLTSNGTTPDYTASNASQSNAIAERRFRQLMAATRLELPTASNMPKSLCSYATLYAAEKSNYLATTKDGIMKPSPKKNIEEQCSTEKASRPQSFLS